MMLFARRVKYAFDVAVQGPQDADAREHCGSARRRHQDQRLHRCLPLRGLVLGLR